MRLTCAEILLFAPPSALIAKQQQIGASYCTGSKKGLYIDGFASAELARESWGMHFGVSKHAIGIKGSFIDRRQECWECLPPLYLHPFSDCLLALEPLSPSAAR